ncbi:hypothetical protein AVEN_241363-1 [Araneus ventricosus]|uniref:Uncharacterized protein n=1 Tax=Araneus ventricosus TaxID=182803 RepID=A0A4Y2VUB5_ARAVE|nr:hypothetical protein AVEN_241363-1 [Araneus ventricosus]
MDQHYYRSASNSLLSHTADRTTKTFALQGDPSRSTFPPSSKRPPYIVSRGRPWRHRESTSTFERISFANRDIEKIPAPLRSHISSPKSPNLSPRSGLQMRLLPVNPYLPLSNSFPNLKTHIAGKRLSMFVTIQMKCKLSYRDWRASVA